MFRIPAAFKFEMSPEEASKVLSIYGLGDILEGMHALDRRWREHCTDTGAVRFESDSDFYEYYEAEVNAYNVVYAGMKKMFG